MKVAQRRDWHYVERCLWERAAAADGLQDAASAALHDEADLILPTLAATTRVIRSGRRPHSG